MGAAPKVPKCSGDYFRQLNEVAETDVFHFEDSMGGLNTAFLFVDGMSKNIVTDMASDNHPKARDAWESIQNYKEAMGRYPLSLRADRDGIFHANLIREEAAKVA